MTEFLGQFENPNTKMSYSIWLKNILKTVYGTINDPFSEQNMRPLLQDMKKRPVSLMNTLFGTTGNNVSMKNYVQCLIKIAKFYSMEQDVVDKLAQRYDEHKANYQADRLSKYQDEADEGVIDFDTIKEKIKDMFGAKSMEYLTIKLYEQVPARDNFGKVVFTNDSDASDNHVSKRTDGRYVLNIKLSKNNRHKDGKRQKVLDDETSGIIDGMAIKEGTHLFRNNFDQPFYMGRMSHYIRRVLKSVGIKNGNINYIRRSWISSQLNKSDSSKSRRYVARQVGHQPQTSALYVRRRIENNQETEPIMTNV